MLYKNPDPICWPLTGHAATARWQAESTAAVSATGQNQHDDAYRYEAVVSSADLNLVDLPRVIFTDKVQHKDSDFRGPAPLHTPMGVDNFHGLLLLSLIHI